MLKYWLWLTNLRGLHNQTRLALLRHFGTPENLFYADEGEILLTEGITREQAALLRDHDLERANRILGDCQRLGLQLLTIQDAAYPARLQNIYDPPVLLYVRGHLPVMDEEAAIAVVGAREPTAYGRRWAEQFGMDVDMVKKYLSKEQVHDQILTQKAVAVVVDSATAEKPKKAAAKKEDAAEGEEKKPAKKTAKKAEAAEDEEKKPAKKTAAKKTAKKDAE